MSHTHTPLHSLECCAYRARSNRLRNDRDQTYITAGNLGIKFISYGKQSREQSCLFLTFCCARTCSIRAHKAQRKSTQSTPRNNAYQVCSRCARERRSSLVRAIIPMRIMFPTRHISTKRICANMHKM